MKLPSIPTLQRDARAPGPLCSWRIPAACVLAATLTAACGGGGTAATEPVVLDKANMQPAARKANDSFVLFELATAPRVFMLSSIAWFESGKPYQCLTDDAQSGTTTYTTSRPGQELQTGDTLTVKFDNCVLDADDPSARMSGAWVLTVRNITGDSASGVIGQPWSYQVLMQYQNLNMLSLTERTMVDGEMLVTESSPGIVNADFHEHVTTTFQTAVMRLTEDADTHTYTQASGTLVSDFTPEETWSATISTELDSTALAGRLSFATVETFKGTLGNPIPAQGQGRIGTGQPQQLLLRAQATGVEGTLTTPQAAESFFIDWANF